MNNILIATEDDEELHKQIVHEVLELIDKENFFLKLSKCLFYQRSINYLGIYIKEGCISIDPTKLDGLADWKEELRNVHKVHATLGVFGYNQPFIPWYFDIIWPLTHLIKKDIPFEWTLECTRAIQRLKAMVQSGWVLIRPDYSKPFTMKVNALQYALRATLYQKNDRSKLQPIGYYSKTLIPAEQNYNVYNQELLGLIRGCYS